MQPSDGERRLLHVNAGGRSVKLGVFLMRKYVLVIAAAFAALLALVVPASAQDFKILHS